jgi:hypothetical protein
MTTIDQFEDVSNVLINFSGVLTEAIIKEFSPSKKHIKLDFDLTGDDDTKIQWFTSEKFLEMCVEILDE